MDSRTQQILKAVLSEFLETGDPISSNVLYRKYKFNVKPATIRNELNDLEQSGFLSQLHISSGRVPTDKAYRFLVDSILENLDYEEIRGFESVVSELSRELTKGYFRDCVYELSDKLGILGAGYVDSEELVYKSGLDDLFAKLASEIWLNNAREALQVIKDFEALDERMADLLDFMSESDGPVVFIGKSPITRSPELSVIAESFNLNGNDIVLAAIGPKRMDYQKGINFFAKLKQNLNK